MRKDSLPPLSRVVVQPVNYQLKEVGGARLTVGIFGVYKGHGIVVGVIEE